MTPNRIRLVLAFALFPVASCAAQQSWANVDCPMTIDEYLLLEFSIRFRLPDAGDLAGSSSEIFMPSDSEERALILITQTWRAETVGAGELRREIRARSTALFGLFKVICESPAVKRRWPKCVPESAFFIRHVLKSDTKEILAVTKGSETEFGEQAVADIKREVKDRGGYF